MTNLDDVPPGILRLLARLLQDAHAASRISIGGAADLAGVSVDEIESLLRGDWDEGAR